MIEVDQLWSQTTVQRILNCFKNYIATNRHYYVAAIKSCHKATVFGEMKWLSRAIR